MRIRYCFQSNIRFNFGYKIRQKFNKAVFSRIPRVGIIGQPMKMFHIKTLMARGNNEEDTNHDNKE